jgi:hypothetical protein
MKIIAREFIKYKFFNSLFLGVSVGSIFTIYTPLEPSLYSFGGVILAIMTLIVAKLYSKILNIEYFFKISLFVELIMLSVVLFFLLSKYSYTTALFVYIGYQITFTFGSYLVRAETLFLKKTRVLSFLDVNKQKGYLGGMIISYLFYKGIEYFFSISSNQDQVYSIHFILLFIQITIVSYLIKSFKKN